jgi:hypothetical protein
MKAAFKTWSIFSIEPYFLRSASTRHPIMMVAIMSIKLKKKVLIHINLLNRMVDKKFLKRFKVLLKISLMILLKKMKELQKMSIMMNLIKWIMIKLIKWVMVLLKIRMIIKELTWITEFRLRIHLMMIE